MRKMKKVLLLRKNVAAALLRVYARNLAGLRGERCEFTRENYLGFNKSKRRSWNMEGLGSLGRFDWGDG